MQSFLDKIFKDNRGYAIDILRKVILITCYFLMMFVLTDPLAEWLKSIFPSMDTVLLSIIFQYIIYVPLFIVAFILMKEEIKKSFNNFNSTNYIASFSFIFACIILAYVANGVGTTISTSLSSESSDSANQEAIVTMFSSKYGPLMVLDVCIIGPIVEELVFRGAIQKGLDKLHVHPAVCIIMASIIFGFIHVIDAGDYVQVFPYIGMGLALGYAYYQSKSLVVSTTVHIFINTFATSIQFFLILLQKLGLFSSFAFVLFGWLV